MALPSANRWRVTPPASSTISSPSGFHPRLAHLVSVSSPLPSRLLDKPPAPDPPAPEPSAASPCPSPVAAAARHSSSASPPHALPVRQSSPAHQSISPSSAPPSARFRSPSRRASSSPPSAPVSSKFPPRSSISPFGRASRLSPSSTSPPHLSRDQQRQISEQQQQQQQLHKQQPPPPQPSTSQFPNPIPRPPSSLQSPSLKPPTLQAPTPPPQAPSPSPPPLPTLEKSVDADSSSAASLTTLKTQPSASPSALSKEALADKMAMLRLLGNVGSRIASAVETSGSAIPATTRTGPLSRATVSVLAAAVSAHSTPSLYERQGMLGMFGVGWLAKQMHERQSFPLSPEHASGLSQGGLGATVRGSESTIRSDRSGQGSAGDAQDTATSHPVGADGSRPKGLKEGGDRLEVGGDGGSLGEEGRRCEGGGGGEGAGEGSRAILLAEENWAGGWRSRSGMERVKERRKQLALQALRRKKEGEIEKQADLLRSLRTLDVEYRLMCEEERGEKAETAV